MSALETLLQIMAELRHPQRGCPWDRRQTYASILPYTLEEAYEVADAIEQEDYASLCGELGDLLFQVVFYSRMAEEDGHFGFEDVAKGIVEKMIRRHPHVFAGEQGLDDMGLQRRWEQHKAVERRQRRAVGAGSEMDGVALALPALMRAEKLQRRAARVGFDWTDARSAFAKVVEECAEVEAELGGDQSALEAELGDLLFAVVNVIRLSGSGAEQTLRGANARFERRFRRMEQIVADHGETLQQASAEALERLWEAVKLEEQGAAGDCRGPGDEG